MPRREASEDALILHASLQDRETVHFCRPSLWCLLRRPGPRWLCSVWNATGPGSRKESSVSPLECSLS